MSDELMEILTKIVQAQHFTGEMYTELFELIETDEPKTKVLRALANTIEEYYNLHNSTSMRFSGHAIPIALPPEAEQYKEEIRLYMAALKKGITDFKSLNDLKRAVNS